MEIKEETVDKIATLARLKFEGSEKARMVEDLNRVLSFVDQLKEVNVEGVEPLIHMTGEQNMLRTDKSEVSITKKEALKNAPQKDSDYFKIPKVMR